MRQVAYIAMINIKKISLLILLGNLLLVSTLPAQTPPILNSLSKNITQALIVEGIDGSIFKAKVTSWQKNIDGWKEIFPSMDAVIGRNGFALMDQKQEGDGLTPSGVYKLGTAFGYAKNISTKMEYIYMTDQDIWIDDPKSRKYNQLIKIIEKGEAKSFEQMKRPDNLYERGIVIEYNTQPIISGKGSAIFIHIWRNPNKPTAGCIALSKKNIIKLLNWLNQKENPVIAINSQKNA